MYLFFAFVYFTFCFSKLKIYFDIVALCTQKKNKKEGLKREQENVFNTQRCQMKIIKIIRNCLCFFFIIYIKLVHYVEETGGLVSSLGTSIYTYI